MDPTELPSSSKRVSDDGMRSQRALMKNSISRREVLFAVGVGMIDHMTLEVLCSSAQWMMRRQFRQSDMMDSRRVHYRMNFESVLG